ncbi:MAG: SOS response-associated peptidase family protein [Saccharofermentanales bacterium]
MGDFSMCGRYLVITEGEIIEMRAILDELGKRFGGIDELPSFGLIGQRPSGLSSQRVSGIPSQLSFLPDTVSGAASVSGSGEVFPGTFAPVLVLDDDAAVLKPMRWGFTRWDGKGVVINARSETVSDKPMFRRALSSGRCIVPSRGFYEWRHGADSDSVVRTPKPRAEKYRILRKDSPLFFMSGIYQIKDGIEEFVILTMPAMEQMKMIHDRMPVFAVNTQIIDWLEDPQSLDLLISNRSASLSLELLRV